MLAYWCSERFLGHFACQTTIIKKQQPLNKVEMHHYMTACKRPADLCLKSPVHCIIVFLHALILLMKTTLFFYYPFNKAVYAFQFKSALKHLLQPPIGNLNVLM